jgi:argininosuccinate lyase
MSTFDIRANLNDTTQGAQQMETDAQASISPVQRGVWEHSLLVNVAHLQELGRAGVIDEGALAAMYRAIDSVYISHVGTGFSANESVREIDERVDALLPGEISGAATLGSTRVETLATALRMTWREQALGVLDQAGMFRQALMDLADVHAVTIMAAVWDRRPANPTTLAHFLGGAIGALVIATDRLKTAIPWIDRSPFGAGVLAGEVMSVDRDEVARALGFDQPIHNTLDALATVEDMVALVEALGANLASSRRLLSELLVWIRTEPTSFFLDERWESVPEPSMPAHTTSARLEALVFELQGGEGEARAAVDLLRSLPYGPLGAAWDAVARAMDRVLESATRGMSDSTDAIHEALIVNRAYLANRAGRMYSTAGDLAPFLMTEEQLPPTAARQIASLVISRLREQNLEASAVTQDIIDSAALMVIGRELKVEMETLGRYLAPRRFIERRDVVGSPAPERTRTWLAAEREQLAADRQWSNERRQRWEAAANALLAVLTSGDDD